MSEQAESSLAYWSQIYGPVDPNKLEGDDSQEIRKDSAKEKSAKGTRMGGETSPFAMDNRDPNNLNPHIQVVVVAPTPMVRHTRSPHTLMSILWDDIIGEAEGLRTPEKCWNCSISCYDGTRRCCYVFLVILCAPLIAFCNGCQFACLAFNHVWCVGPCLRMWKINMATLKKFWEAWLYAVCLPMFETCGMCCAKASVKYQKLPDAMTAETSSDYFNV
ncbi:caveolin-3-like isoform X2 [Macrobrachium nipponense]|uniref:caveolin-3-like isoform X2 n=1 Tax=Macrobrachium nipponense TaxID=159736 RepID=UPI0030C88183